MSRLGRPVTPIFLSEEEQSTLDGLIRKRNAPAQEVQRAKMVLLASQGLSNRAIADELSVHAQTVGYWRKRFAAGRLPSLSEAPRSGRPRTISDEQVAEVVRLTLEQKPEASTHWSTRLMAQSTGLSNKTISHIWRAFQLQPHRTESFTLSKDPYFVDKVRDVVGLCMSPPDNALVFCVDEKSQIQALERSQPILPLRPGAPERQTHDYYRHGTTSLFAALDVATGRVISSLKPRHRSREFLSFLRQIERTVPDGLDIHIVLDNYATHKTDTVNQWLSKRPHWHLHFIPTHSSWLNQVERFFALITSRAIRRGSFGALDQLKRAINQYIEQHNQNPKPFVWTASADAILAKVAQLCSKLR
ncbi:IS630 family transposase [Ruficoccus amylovorans]|uniref:IS630 family transposase n=1 Tax=Ruficoccus amylovorans TaxID=1804625 RepID=A0A842HGX1_9BACT|nr:IS630 family transposase [Ruficoccus amylovorans]MBC2594491.1 IS630 family transposase [Ruficoccus amylovorans]